MKTKLFLSLLVALSFAAQETKAELSVRHGMQPSNNLSDTSFVASGYSVGPIVTIEIGRKKFGCLRFGICRITIDPNPQDTLTVLAANKVSGTGSVNGKKLSMEFYRSSMTPSTFDTYFGGDSFIVEEDFQLPADVATVLGVKSYTIKAGIYPIVVLDNNNLLVNF